MATATKSRPVRKITVKPVPLSPPRTLRERHGEATLVLQQGDILIKKLPDDVTLSGKRIKDNHVAEGELTGHYHEILGKDVKVFDRQGVRYVDAPHGAELRHQEHATQVLEPGKYWMDGVVEFDHWTETSRRVFD